MSTIELTTLSPVHVGTGFGIPAGAGYLYFEKERCLSVLDDEKVLSVIGGVEQLHQWVAKVNQPKALLEYLQSRKKDLKPEDLSKRILRNKSGQRLENQTIREHIHSCGKLYLPGSSIKGSFRTVLFQHEVAEDHNNNKTPDDRFNSIARDEALVKDKFTDEIISQKIFGKSADQDVLRLLRVGDLHFDTQSVVLKTIGLNTVGDERQEIKASISQFAECIPAQSKARGRIYIADKLRERTDEKGTFQSRLRPFSLPELFAKAKTYMDVLLNDELGIYESLDLPDAAEEFVPKLEELLELNSNLQEGNECIIRLGYGSGYRFMTGGFSDYLNSDMEKALSNQVRDPKYRALSNQVRRPKYEDYRLPKSRRMLNGGVPLGFVKIKIVG